VIVYEVTGGDLFPSTCYILRFSIATDETICAGSFVTRFSLLPVF
jgi:hypothetical protein